VGVLQKFNLLGVPLAVIFPHATSELGHNKRCGPWP